VIIIIFKGRTTMEDNSNSFFAPSISTLRASL